jgi:hypothetical protein
LTTEIAEGTEMDAVDSVFSVTSVVYPMIRKEAPENGASSLLLDG